MSKFLWNIQSVFYRNFRRNPISERILRRENDSISDLLKEVPSAQLRTILDIGTGRGNSIFLFRGYRAKIIALDYSCFMVRKTQSCFSDISFIQADAHLIPLKKNYFNLVVCLGVFEYLKNPGDVLQEINRVLIKGGYAVITIPSTNLLNVFRNLFGHRIFITKPDTFKQIVKQLNLEIIREGRTQLQLQYLLRKLN